jgi:HAD superfamily hydrolase (TIGR01662 family)
MTDQTAVRTVLFDLGFTLTYFDGDFEKTTSESYVVLGNALNRQGCHLNVVKFADRFQDLIVQYYHDRDKDLVERPVEDLIHRVLKRAGQDHLPPEKIRQAMDEMYAVTEERWKLEADAHSTLQDLISRGYRLGMVTNAADAVDVAKIVDNHRLRIYFDAIIISADYGIRKPDPRIFEIALQRMAADRTSTVMVGDNLGADILGAHRAGLRGIWITRRSEDPRSALLRNSIIPDAEVAALADLPELLQSWEAGDGQKPH